MSESGTISSSEILRHVDFVRTLARAMTDDRFIAEDLAQDALLSAIENPPAEGANLKAWFTVVVKNRWRFLLRSRRRRDDTLRRFVERTEGDLEQRSRAGDPIHGQAGSPELARAFLGLSPRYREVLLLRYWKDMPPREIAVELDVPLHTVKTRLQRGLARLRDREAILQGEKRWSPLVLLAALRDRVAEWIPQSWRTAQLQLLGLVVVVGATSSAWMLTRDDDAEPVLESVVALAALEPSAEASRRSGPGPEPEPQGEPKPEAGSDVLQPAPKNDAVPRTYRVTIRSGEGLALAGARVWSGEKIVARSGAQGEAMFTVRPHQLLRFDHPEYRTTSSLAADLEAIIKLAPAFRYDLSVRDRESGRTIAGVQARARHTCVASDGTTHLHQGKPVAMVPGQLLKIDQHDFTIEFDEEGRAIAPFAPKSYCNMLFKAPGYVTTTVPIASGEAAGRQRVVVEMVPSARLFLTAPKDGTYFLRFVAQNGYERGSPETFIQTLKANEPQAIDLPPGDYRATLAEFTGADAIESWQHSILDATTLAQASGRIEYAEFHLRREAPITHRLFSRRDRRLVIRGEDLVGATLELVHVDPRVGDDSFAVERRFAVRKNGTDVFEGVSAGRYRLVLRRDGAVEREVELEISGEADKTLSLQLPEGSATLTLRGAVASQGAWWSVTHEASLPKGMTGLRVRAVRHRAHSCAEGLRLPRLTTGPGQLMWFRAEKLERRTFGLTPGRHEISADDEGAEPSFEVSFALENVRRSFEGETITLRDETGVLLPVIWRVETIDKKRSVHGFLPQGNYWLGDTLFLGRIDRLEVKGPLHRRFGPAPYWERRFRLVDEEGRALAIMPTSVSLLSHAAPVATSGMAPFRGSTDARGAFCATIRPEIDYVIELADGRRHVLTAQELAEQTSTEERVLVFKR